VSPNFGDKLVFKAIQSIEAGTGSPVDTLSDRELDMVRFAIDWVAQQE
jgi:hypothetical protein